ncbi:flavin reductase family protein [Streptomyces ficellus]|uniref:Flavin reductase family protein n=1 Tax=Streptomyces ficellus TaxID=1977088 RepID=A0ABT7Z7C4_9ACTN|nr:flavin reductase family protein [Streptomyces ficellus]MDN3295402.1 flavin reductase family protein [Streptomyces ficellus]
MTETATALLSPPETAAFRAAMGRFPTGVTLLTQGSGDGTSVITLNSLTSVSLDPLLILVSVKADGRIRPRVVRAGSFAVNVLSRRHQELGQEFCRPDRPAGLAAMRRLGAAEGVTGNAVVPSAEAYFECVLDAAHPAGDHTLLVGRVVALAAADGNPDPLVFHQGRFTRLPLATAEAA